MPRYRYTIIDKAGKRVSKVVTAPDRERVVRTLNELGNSFIVEIRDITRLTHRPRQFSVNDKIFFTQNLAVLLSSGISLGEAVGIIASDMEGKSVGAFFLLIQNDLEQGSSLSFALSRYPKIFDPVYISLVEAGENSGELSKVMDKLADGIERDAHTIAQVKSALLYPIFVLSALFILGLVLTFFVLPKVTRVFSQLSLENIPLTTKLLIGYSDFVGKYPFFVLSAIVGIVAVGVTFFRLPPGRAFVSLVANRLPILKQIVIAFDLARLSSTLALLLNAGVPIQRAIRIASGTVKNPKLNREFREGSEKLATGISLARTMSATSLPKTFVALVAMGERSGNVASIFQTLSNHYEDQLDSALKNFTSILEPVLTLVVGLIVAGVVMTIIVPIYQFIGNLEPG